MSGAKLAHVRRKTARRLIFSGIVLVLYFSFTLNWTAWGDWLRNPVAGTAVSGSVVMFVGLIVLFILLEFLFIALGKGDDHQ